MPGIIALKVSFPVHPKELYDLYLNSAKHAQALGWADSVVIERRVGGKMRVGSYITGRLLHLVPDRMIVQTWRAGDWKEAEPDSVLVLQFEKTKGGARLSMTHVGIPATKVKTLTWNDSYWRPWRAWLKRKKK